MSIKSDKWITKKSIEDKMIEPFSKNQVISLSPMEYLVMVMTCVVPMNLKYLQIFILCSRSKEF